MFQFTVQNTCDEQRSIILDVDDECFDRKISLSSTWGPTGKHMPEAVIGSLALFTLRKQLMMGSR